MNALPRQCAEPGCGGKTLEGHRCRRHARVWVGGQPSSAYGSGWSRFRAQVLAEEPRCRSCGAPAVTVDHILAIAFGGSHDRRNLQPLCHACEVVKTAADSRRGKARKRAGGLFPPIPPDECTSSAASAAEEVPAGFTPPDGDPGTARNVRDAAKNDEDG